MVSLKVATWNVNSIRPRLPIVLDWLKEMQPDILLLQETKAVDADFPRDIFEDRGYTCALFGQKTYNGVAILSRSSIEDVRWGLPTLPETQDARYIEGFTMGVRVASIYVPNGQMVGGSRYDEKKAFFRALGSHVSQLLTYDEPLICGGDYNVAPYDTDVYDAVKWRGRLLCSAEEREAFRSLVLLGLTDVLCHHEDPVATKNAFTWWDYRSRGWERDEGLRIDHLLLSPQAVDRLIASGVDRRPRDRERPSDHTPVWCTLTPS